MRRIKIYKLKHIPSLAKIGRITVSIITGILKILKFIVMLSILIIWGILALPICNIWYAILVGVIAYYWGYNGDCISLGFKIFFDLTIPHIICISTVKYIYEWLWWDK